MQEPYETESAQGAHTAAPTGRLRQFRRAETAVWGAMPPSTRTEILRWTSAPNLAGTVKGFLSAQLPSGLIINDMRLMVGPKGRHWLAMPAGKAVDKNGNPIVNRDGKPLWNTFVEFRDRESRDRFQQQVLDALREQHTAALDGSGP
jgi:hypothetical protein